MPQAVAAAAVWVGQAIGTAVGATLTAAGVAGATALPLAAVAANAAYLVAEIAIYTGLQNLIDDIAHEKPSPQGYELALRNAADVPREMIIGQRPTAGSVVARYSWGSNLYNAGFVYQLADHPCVELSKVYGDGRLVRSTPLVHGVRTEITAYSYSGGPRIWMTWHDGRPGQTADADLITKSALDPDVVSGVYGGWTSAHRGAGNAYVFVEVQFDSDILTSIPEFLFDVKGAPLYDRRKDTTAGGSGAHRHNLPATWEWTANAAVALDHYMLGYQVEDDPLAFGVGLSPIEVPYATFAQLADLSDEDVVTGEGDAEATIKRFEANGIISAASGFEDTIETFANQMCAKVVDLGGQIGVLGAEERTSVVTLSDADWATDESVRYAPHLAFSDLYGAVIGSFPDPANLWQPTPYERQTTAYLQLPDGGEAPTAQLDLPLETNSRRAVRIASAWIARESLQPRLAGTFATRSNAWRLAPGDWFTMSSERLQFTTQLFEVVDNVRHEDFTITMTARAIDPDFLAFSTDDDPDLSVPPALDPYDLRLSVPVFTPTASTITGGGATEPVISVVTTAPNPVTRELVIEAQEWNGTTLIGPVLYFVAHADDLTTVLRQGLKPATSYKVRMKARAGERESPWSAWSTVVTTGATYNVPTATAASTAVAGSALDINLAAVITAAAAAAVSASAALASEAAALAHANNSDAARALSVAAKTASELARDNAQAYEASANGFATAASGHATTATTQAGLAGTSAAAAAAAVVSAKFTVAAAFPAYFERDGEFFTADYGNTGTPLDLTAGTFVNVTGEGRVFQSTGANAAGSKGLLQIRAGRIYSILSRYRILTNQSNGHVVQPLLGPYVFDATKTPLGGMWVNSFVTKTTADGWVNQTGTITTANILAAFPTGTFLRPVAIPTWSPTGTTNGIAQTASLVFMDITEQEAAAASAAASSVSEAAAAVSASGANVSAIAANSHKNDANTYQGQAFTYSGNAAASAITAGTHAATATAQATLAATSAAATLPSGFADASVWDVVAGTVTFPLGVATSASGGSAIVSSKGSLPIITGHTYRTTARHRVTVDGTNNYHYIGFALFNPALTLLGFHWSGYATTAAEGWQTESGIFTTAALLGAYPTATTVRATILMRYENVTGLGSGATSECTALEMRDITESETATAQAVVATTQAATATAAAATATAQATLAAAYTNAGVSGLVNNARFQVPQVGTQVPSGWTSGANGAGTLVARVGSTGMAFRLVGGASADAYVYQSIPGAGVQPSGKYLIRATARRTVNSFVGAGVTIDWYNNVGTYLSSISLILATEASVHGVTSSTPDGVTSWEKQVSAPATAYSAVLLFGSHFSAWGATTTANQIDWHEVDLVPIESAHVRLATAEATIVTQGVTIASHTASLASQATTIAANFTALSDRLANHANRILNSTGANGLTGWVNMGSWYTALHPVWGYWFTRSMTGLTVTEYPQQAAYFAVNPSSPYTLSFTPFMAGRVSGSLTFYAVYYNSGGTYVGEGGHIILTADDTAQLRREATFTTGATTAYVRFAIALTALVGNGTYAQIGFWQSKIEQGTVATTWSDDPLSVETMGRVTTAEATIITQGTSIATANTAISTLTTTVTANYTSLRAGNDGDSLPSTFEKDDLYWSVTAGSAFASVAGVGRVWQSSAVSHSAQSLGRMVLRPSRTYRVTARYRVSTDATNGILVQPLAGMLMWDQSGNSVGGAWCVPAFTNRTVADGWITATIEQTTAAIVAASTGSSAVTVSAYLQPHWHPSNSNSNAITQVQFCKLEDVTDIVTTNAQVATNIAAIATANGAMAVWETIVAATGGDPAVVRLKAGLGGSEISLAARILSLINTSSGVAIEVMRAIGGEAFFSRPISSDDASAGRRVTIGPGYGASGSKVVLWFGPDTIAPASQSRVNGYFALGTDGQVYLGAAPITTVTAYYGTHNGPAYGGRMGAGFVTSSVVTITPVNGTAPFHYAFTILDNPHSLTLNASDGVGQDNFSISGTISAAATWRMQVAVDVTDAIGRTTRVTVFDNELHDET